MEARDVPASGPIRATGTGCLFVLEDEGVFFATAQQALYVFNTPATLIWCCIEEGFSADEIVRQYADTFDVDHAEARGHVTSVLDQWQGMGYIESRDVQGQVEISFATALGRLLGNDALRAEFAKSPSAAAGMLRLASADREAFMSLNPRELERQASRLGSRARRDVAPAGTDTLFSAMIDQDHTVLEFATGARWRRLGAPAIERLYRMLTTSVRVRFATAAQEAHVHPALAHVEIDASLPSDVVFDVLEDGDRHVILEDLLPVGHCLGLGQLTPVVKSLIVQRALNRHPFFLQLHAGVVSNGERCVVLPGAPGSGKTTLTAGLAFSGFQYFSDEVALLEDKALTLRPFPLALGIKPGSVGVLEKLCPQVRTLQPFDREDGQRVRYLSPDAGTCAAPESALPAGWLIFPRYGTDLETELKPLRKPEALRRLMHECMVLPQLLDEARVGRFVQWMRSVECYELPMSSLGEAVRLVKKLCLDSRLQG
jgi:hypothetical protein